MHIGSLKFDHPIALAPMEDVTDVTFRLICKRLGADIVYTEFTSSEAIIRDIPKAFKKITVVDAERPVAIQLFGGIDDSMEAAARKAETFHPDFIDINCGCWVKNHVARHEGAGLLRDLDRFERIVRSTVKGTSLPVTVKTRLGWDADSINILDVARMVEQSGAQALTVHCRTRSQGYKGQADWEWLHKIKKVISIPLIGNGDVTTPQEAKAMLATGCDGIMIGRGAISNPWIFQQIKHYLSTGQEPTGPSLKEKVELCIEHLRLFVTIKDVPNPVLPFRKYFVGYLHGIPHIAHLRRELMRLETPNAIEDSLWHFLYCYEKGLDVSELC